MYKDKIVDLSAEAIEIRQTIKKFKHKETVAEIRVQELEEKNKQYSKHIKNLQKDLSKTHKDKKNPELINSIGELAELTKKYKNMSKEAKGEVNIKGKQTDKLPKSR